MGGKRRRSLERLNGRRNIIGERLHLARHHHMPPWTMQNLCDAIHDSSALDITVATIGKIEAGVRGAYDWEVAACAQALRVSADWLLGLDNEE